MLLSDRIKDKAGNIRLIVSDLDGTLFRSGKTVSAETLDIINRVRDKGIGFTVNTGRSFTWLGGFIEYLGIDCPAITANGCEITDGKTGERLYTACLSSENVYKCAEYLNRYRLSWHIETTEGWVLPDYLHNMDMFPGFYPDLELNGFSTDRLWNIGNVNISEIVPLKIIVWVTYGNEGGLLSELAKDMEGVDLLHSAGNIYELLPPGANKGSTFLRMCDIMKISPLQCCTLGDFDNDLPMMEASGISVAVANAPDYVREKADIVTDSNNNDGVAKALQLLFL